jgi:hypothetical protein
LNPTAIRRSAIEILFAVGQYEQIPQDLWNDLHAPVSRLLRLSTGKPVPALAPEAQRVDEVRSLLERNADLAKKLKETREELAAANHDRGILAQRVLHLQRVERAKGDGPTIPEPEEQAKIHAAAVSHLASLVPKRDEPARIDPLVNAKEEEAMFRERHDAFVEREGIRPIPDSAFAEPLPREAFQENESFRKAREYLRTLIRIPAYVSRMREQLNCQNRDLERWAMTNSPMPRLLVDIAHVFMNEYCNGFAVNKDGAH